MQHTDLDRVNCQSTLPPNIVKPRLAAATALLNFVFIIKLQNLIMLQRSDLRRSKIVPTGNR